jgi:hypothetical protein
MSKWARDRVLHWTSAGSAASHVSMVMVVDEFMFDVVEN